jgi:PAS domain S-box-containing protein
MAEGKLQLRLYVVSGAPNSIAARANLAEMLAPVGEERYTLDIVDCVADPHRALADGVFVTPTLMKIFPTPAQTIVGSLSNRGTVMAALGLEGAATVSPEEYRKHVASLIQRLSEADGALSALTEGQVDAVLDPTTAAPILLSRAREVLTQSEARYRDLITRAPSIVCELSPGGTVSLINDTVRAMLGWEPAALEGKNMWRLLVHEGDRPQVEEFRRAMRSRNVTGYELPMRHRDGRSRWVAWNSANRYSADGVLQSLVLFGIDVTDRREAEENNRRLTEAELARTRAEAANKAKMEFLAVMSHELRTPLNAIGGYAQLLEMGIKGPVSSGQVEDLQRIRRSQAHLLGLINDIMNFVRLETGRVVFHSGLHPVKELLENIEALTAPQIRANGLQYLVTPCDPSLSVWGDRDKIQQILINLVSNSIKFTASGGVIEVKCEASDGHVVFNISDTGKGIPKNKLAEIFDPFVQVNPKFSRSQDGVGLGLAISRDLARGMGGDLTAESAEGVGSTFTLRLPRDKDSVGSG